MQAMKALGLKFKLGKHRFRLWRSGLEYGTNLGGRVIMFPWNSYYLRKIREIKK